MEAAHHTTAQANCIFHLRIRPEAPLAAPSMAAMMATNACGSSRPLLPRAGNRRSMEMHTAIQIEETARPMVVDEWPPLLLAPMTMVSTMAATIVTGQAKATPPHTGLLQDDQPMAM